MTTTIAANPEQFAEFYDVGWTVVDGILTADEVRLFRKELERCIEEDLQAWAGKEYRDAYMVYALMTRADCFATFLENKLLHAYVDTVLGDTCLVNAYTSSSMPPHGSNYSNRIHVDAPRYIPGYVTNAGMIVALDDFTVENGAISALPNSTKRQDRPSDEEYERDSVRICPKVGQGIFINARVWHRGEVNHTDAPRHSITMNCCRSYMRTQFDYPRMVPESIANSLGDVGRRFLGFNVRMPKSLNEFYLPEDQRLYKPNQG